MQALSVLVGFLGLAAFANPPAQTEENTSGLKGNVEQPAEQPAEQPKLTKNPSLIHSEPAAFPPEMEAEQQSGTVVLELEIDAEGDVRDVRVLESAGEAFDKAAVEAAWKYRFSPAEVDGVPAPVRIHYRSEFFFRPTDDGPSPTATDNALGELSGELVERGTRVPIADALVVLGEGESAEETFSDKEGRFSFLGLTPGTWKLSVSSAEHERFATEETIHAKERTHVRYYVLKKTYGAFQTTVRGTKNKREVSQVSLQQEEIRLIPGTQGDAFKVVLNLPGVARPAFSMGSIVVRGTRQRDTRFYVDDVNIPILFHFGGLFATVNSSLLERLDFEPGSFGVAYGRSIGGLIKGNIRSPASSGLHGYADVSISGASALVEGPVGKGWSVLASGRRSYVDAVLPLAMKMAGAGDRLQLTVAPRYYDYQLRAEHRSEAKNSRFFIFLFGSDDKMDLLMPNSTEREGRNSFGNTTRYGRLAVGWERRFSDKLFFKTRNALGFDLFRMSLGDDIFINGTQYPLSSRNEVSFTFTDNATLRVGADLSFQPIYSNIQMFNLPRVGQISNPLMASQIFSEKETYIYFEPAVYAEMQYSPFKGFQMVGGLRADYNSHINKAWLDARLALSHAFTERIKLKGAIGTFQQAPDYINGQVSPVFGNTNLKPEGSIQTSFGLEANLTKALDVDLQFYARRGFNIARQTLGSDAQADLSADDTSQNWGNAGNTRAYGMEILLRHQLTDRFFGWIAYSLSRAEVSDLNYGGYRRSWFDQPHNLIVVASYKLPLDFILGAKLQYTSGSLSSAVIGTVFDANSGRYRPLRGRRNTERAPDFLQLDVRLDKRFVFNRWMLSLYLDVQNVTNRKNPEGVVYSYDFSKRDYFSGLPILPSFGIRGEF